MKKIVRLIVILLLLISLLSVNVIADGAVPQDVLDSVESVVRIIAEYNDGYATGSGFVIQSDSNATLIVTNHHVVEDNPKSISIWTETGIKVAVTVLADDAERDLCILQLPYPNAALKALVLDEAGVKRGDAVYAVGFPGAADVLTLSEAYSSEAATITTGIISTIRTTHAVEGGKEFRLLQSTAPINHGNSGGPLFNTLGYVVGVNTYSVEDSAGIYGAIHVGELIDFATQNGISVRLPEESHGPSVGLIIGATAGVAVLIAAVILLVVRKKRKKAELPETEPITDEVSLEVTQEATTDTADERQAVVNTEPKKRLHIKPRYVIAAAAALLLIGVGITGYLYVSHYQKALQSADNGSFAEAESNLFLPFITKLHDSQFVDYLQAGKLLENGQFDAAKEAFSKLTGYKKADEYLLETEYRRGVDLLNNGEYDLAEAVFQELAESGYSESEEMIYAVKYSHAEALINEKQYDAAIEIFTDLSKSNYKDSSERILETQYLHAQDLLDNEEDYENAYEMLKSLGDYSDAKETLEGCLFLWAADYLNKDDSLNALRVLEYGKNNSTIKIEIEKLKESIYQEAISLYRANNEDKQFDAFIMFYVLYPYDRATDYIALLKEKNALFDWDINSIPYLSDNDWQTATGDFDTDIMFSHLTSFYKKCKEKGIKMEGNDPSREERYWPDKVIYQFDRKKEVDKITHSYSDIVKLLGFEDAADLIFENAEYTKTYLTGTWRTGDGKYYFTMDSDGYAKYDLPGMDFGEYYRIENGNYLLYYEKDPENTRTLFSFEIVNKDTINIYCYKDYTSYRLIRQ